MQSGIADISIGEGKRGFCGNCCIALSPIFIGHMLVFDAVGFCTSINLVLTIIGIFYYKNTSKYTGKNNASLNRTIAYKIKW